MDQGYLTDISYRHFIESVKDYAIYMLDLDGNVISWNKGAERAKGYASQEIIGKFYGIFYSDDDQQLKIPQNNLSYAKDHGQFEGEGWRYKKNGDRFWAHVVIDAIYTYKGFLEGFAKITKDITEQKAFLDRISYLAKYDSLTDLPNRNEFFSLAELTINKSPDEQFALYMFGIENFKELIDNRGYQATDHLLKTIATQLKGCIINNELIARFANKQFVVLKRINNKQQAIDYCQRLYHCFSDNHLIDYRKLSITVGIGISIYPESTKNLEELVNNADFAMLRAYKKLEERICFYDKEIDGKNKQIKMIKNDMLEGILRDEFFLVYQKKFSLKTDSIAGYEALLRWNHSKLGIISPDVFIPIAEDTGKIIPLGYWILETVCNEALTNQINQKISVNLSPVQLKDPNFISKVKEILARTKFPSTLLDFEVTETAVMLDKTISFKILKELQSMGITISLDDFGTGYSSLKLLHDFNFDYIKLDRSFINNIEYSAKSLTFLQTIISLVNAINTPLIAEGVETNEQLAILREKGCDQIQGFIFGRPNSFKEYQ